MAAERTPSIETINRAEEEIKAAIAEGRAKAYLRIGPQKVVSLIERFEIPEGDFVINCEPH